MEKANRQGDIGHLAPTIKQALTDSEAAEIEAFEQRRYWHQRNNSESRGMRPITGLDTSFLNSIKIIGKQSEVGVSKAEGEMQNARRYGTAEDRARARRQLDRARTSAGLE